MKQHHWLRRGLLYAVGLLVIAFGVAFSVNSDLGVSPVNSLPYVISEITQTALSTCVIIVFCVYIAIQVLLLKKEFHPINLLQILFSTLFGYFVDFAKGVVGDFAIPTYAGQLTMLVISIGLIALGVLLYVEAGLVPMPMEGLAMAVAKKTGRPFAKMKILVDCLSVGCAAAVSLLFLGRLAGVREGTVITAIAAGRVVGVLKGRLSPWLHKQILGES